jgi:hypothetical protein
MPCSQPGPSVIGRKIPDSSRSGTTSVLTIGANASSLLSSKPVAYDTEARPIATSTMKPNPMATAAMGARNPNATPTRTSTAAWTTSVTTSRSTRPVMMASLLTGVTRNRSITPAFQSAMIVNPTNVEPNSPSWMSSPGTKKSYALPLLAPLLVPTPSAAVGSRVSSGPISARYRIGWVRPMMTQAGLRNASRSWRRKIISVSRKKDTVITPLPLARYPRYLRQPRGRSGRAANRRGASARSG